jgi:hypothetical protein
VSVELAFVYVDFLLLLAVYAEGSVLRNIDEEAIRVVDRPKMLQFLQSLKRSDGSFSLHDRGESDTRGSKAYVLIILSQQSLIFLRLLCRCGRTHVRIGQCAWSL